VAHTSPKDFDTYLADLKKRAVEDGGVAANQIRQRQAIISLDIPGELELTLPEAAKKVRAKLLVIVSPQDHMVNPIPAQQFAAAIGAPVITLDSPCGHIALECVSAGPTVAKFLSNPASVSSQTLHDPAQH
jgi:homoserine O-acetyltransferase